MAKKLNNVLNKILTEEEEAEKEPANPSLEYKFDIIDTSRDPSDYRDVDEDKTIIAIQNHLINGDFEKANELIRSHSFSTTKNKSISWHHMEQLVNWVRGIYKYTNMKDLSKSYYDNREKEEIQGMKDISKVAVKKETIDKFVKDVEKVLTKKLKIS